jgi:Txe/YoeB family toxin of Txe-Axe toxin-antitoxin module
MDKVSFTNTARRITALTHYITWQTEDRKTLKRINSLIKDIQPCVALLSAYLA